MNVQGGLVAAQNEGNDELSGKITYCPGGSLGVVVGIEGISGRDCRMCI